ncbi:MAG: hypothetical protein JKP98_23985 [Rhodobacteraceae bacterium]|nr:hypothetical protein [Paracoccaceae bacterium]
MKVRLISMTCLNYNGTVLEVPVEGYMAGDGKAGVRGAVVSREGDLVRNAAIAGALEGLGSGISAAGSAVLGTDRNNAGQVLNATGAGMIGGGLGEAASALSAYYIDRAEQYQPVVSLYGGTGWSSCSSAGCVWDETARAPSAAGAGRLHGVGQHRTGLPVLGPDR